MTKKFFMWWYVVILEVLKDMTDIFLIGVRLGLIAFVAFFVFIAFFKGFMV